jgi:hypothetical protein
LVRAVVIEAARRPDRELRVAVADTVSGIAHLHNILLAD